MRLLFFTQAFLPTVGGAERFLDGLARRLIGRGHEVTVLAAHVRGSGPGDPLAVEREEGRRARDAALDTPYRLVRYPKPFSKRFLPRHTAGWLLREHARARPECVHAQGAYPQGYSVELYCRWTALPWVVRAIGYDVEPDERIQREPRLAARAARALCAATRVVAQSAELEGRLLALGVARERIVRIANAVDVTPFETRHAEPASVPTIGALGIFFRKKGFDVLLEAFARVRARVPDARLAIAGDGVERETLLAQARALGVADALELPGLVDGPAKVAFLQRAWLFVSSSRREPFSNANLEALAAGLPLVATAVGGNLEIVVDGLAENGLLVPPGDPAALAAALVELLRDAPRRARMGAASRTLARRYDWDGVVDRYEALYSELCARARERAH